ncbi:thymidylate synthase [Corynebacterium sp. HMSC070E08]|uniref:FAD-dependent thymidylate synthase n=1 Tax=Corynebacterium sp. HMSC070E08 TaxID=1715006 RepID=UPI0008A34DB0|nr:FAD-dependent thymidylate synthase [Corynebacterium sp. HMSC070E08]OFN80081.1 thymidylate synthase [Corynebacterium sp. HMSC070E08]
MPNFAMPNVHLLAHTKIDEKAISEWMGIQDASTDAETLLTMAGRNCYRSFHRPNEATYDDADYLRRTLFQQGHMSIAEHATATLYFTGVSRAFLAELTRHRHLSFSVESQRFIDADNINIVVPPAIRASEDPYVLRNFINAADEAIAAYMIARDELEGLPKKQRNEAARGLLPNCVETRMVVTGNLRAWVETLQKRLTPGADAEMQEVSRLALDALHPTAPSIYEHLKGSAND